MTPTFDDHHLLGLDTSHFVRPVNWALAKSSGVQWMYSKATEALGVQDYSLKSHIDGARAQGVLATAYHFFHAKYDGHEQAEFFLKTIQGLKLDLPCVLDWEWGSVDVESSEKQQLEASKWLNDVEQATGKTPWLYMPYHMIPDLNLPETFARYPLILQRYGAQGYATGPWKALLAWQFSDSYPAPGVAHGHTCDANVFFGTMEDLQEFAK